MEIIFKPYDKITFRSHLKYDSSEEFLRVIGTGSPAGMPNRTRLFWANGILFRHFSLAPTDSNTKEIIKGHLHMDHIEFAGMPEYQQDLIASTDRPLVTIYVVDVSNHVVFDPFTKWIKENLL